MDTKLLYLAILIPDWYYCVQSYNVECIDQIKNVLYVYVYNELYVDILLSTAISLPNPAYTMRINRKVQPTFVLLTKVERRIPFTPF